MAPVTEETATRPPRTPAAIVRDIYLPTADEVFSCDLTPDGRTGIVACGKLVFLLDLQRNKISRQLAGHNGNIASVAISNDSMHTATACYDGKVRVYNHRFELVKSIGASFMHSCAESVCMRGDGKRLLAIFSDTESSSKLVMYERFGGNTYLDLFTHEFDERIRNARVLWRENIVAFTTNSNQVRRAHVYKLDPFIHIHSFSLSDNDRSADVAVAQGTAQIVFAENQELLVLSLPNTVVRFSRFGYKVPEHRTPCAVTDDGRYIVAPLDDRMFGVWSSRTESRCFPFPNNFQQPWRCAVSPDGRHTLVGFQSGLVQHIENSFESKSLRNDMLEIKEQARKLFAIFDNGVPYRRDDLFKLNNFVRNRVSTLQNLSKEFGNGGSAARPYLVREK